MIKLNSIEYNPGIAAQLCREFDLDFDLIQRMWMFKRDPKLFKEKLEEYYG